jgi:hypothetical protein
MSETGDRSLDQRYLLLSEEPPWEGATGLSDYLTYFAFCRLAGTFDRGKAHNPGPPRSPCGAWCNVGKLLFV